MLSGFYYWYTLRLASVLCLTWQMTFYRHLLCAYFYSALKDSNMWELYGSNSPFYFYWASFLLTYFSLILHYSVVLSIIWFFVNCNILWSSLTYLPPVRIWICFSQIYHVTNIQEPFKLNFSPTYFHSTHCEFGQLSPLKAGL